MSYYTAKIRPDKYIKVPWRTEFLLSKETKTTRYVKKIVRKFKSIQDTNYDDRVLYEFRKLLEKFHRHRFHTRIVDFEGVVNFSGSEALLKEINNRLFIHKNGTSSIVSCDH